MISILSKLPWLVRRILKRDKATDVGSKSIVEVKMKRDEENADIIVKLYWSGKYTQVIALTEGEFSNAPIRIDAIIAYGESCIRVRALENILGRFKSQISEIIQNSWALALYTRLLSLCPTVDPAEQTEASDKMHKVFTDNSKTPEDIILELQAHIRACRELKIDVDPRLMKVLSIHAPDNILAMDMIPMQFVSRPPDLRFVGRSNEKSMVTLPSAVLIHEPGDSRNSATLDSTFVCEMGAPSFWEVRGAKVFMSEGVYGLVQFVDGTFYEPCWLGALNKNSSITREYGGNCYLVPSLVPGFASDLQKLDGQFALPFRFADTYYFHFMTETVRYVDEITRHIPGTCVLLPASPGFFSRFKPSVHDEALSYASGQFESRRISDGVYEVDRLLVPTTWTYGKLDYADEILSQVKIEKNDSYSDVNILLTRPVHQGRSIANQDDVAELIRNKLGSVSIVSLDMLSFQEQVSLFNQARTIFSPHGGGLTNIMFCRPGTRLVELHNAESGRMYWDLANLRGMEYYGYVVSSKSVGESATTFGAPFEIDLPTFEKMLEKIGP